MISVDSNYHSSSFFLPNSFSYFNDTYYDSYTTTAMMEDPAYISFSSWDEIRFWLLLWQSLESKKCLKLI